MNKDEILKALELKDEETLEILYMISTFFKKDEILKFGEAIQDKENRDLIIKYL